MYMEQDPMGNNCTVRPMVEKSIRYVLPYTKIQENPDKPREIQENPGKSRGIQGNQGKSREIREKTKEIQRNIGKSS